MVKHEQPFIISWLITNSNAKEEDIMRVKTNDTKDGLMRLVTAATQLQAKQKLSQEHQYKDIISMLMTRCKDRYGNRLMNLRQNIDPEGEVTWIIPPTPKAY